MGINWLTPEFQGIGNALGYSYHNKMMRQYTSKLIDIEDKFSDVTLQITPAEQFLKVEYKTNILFSMFEMLDIPESYKKPLKDADYVIVPCKFVQKIFQPYTRIKPFIVQEGIDPKDFHFYQRTNPFKDGKGKRLRVYWSGAPNPRKGYQYALELLKHIIKIPNVELYIKTTFPKLNPLNVQDSAKKILDSGTILNETQKKHFEALANGLNLEKQLDMYCKNQTIQYYGKYNNIIFDTRRVDFQELTQLYNLAHIFIFPSMGEGWGLMGCEAMATGLPVIAPQVTGIADYFSSEVGYPIPYEIVMQKLSNYKLEARTYQPMLEPFIKKVFEVIDSYDKALVVGKKASNHIHENFTWDKKAKDLVNVIKNIKAKTVLKINNDSKLLTLCIPSFNMATQLDYLLLSISQQKDADKIKIILSNNSSEDETNDVYLKWKNILNIDYYLQEKNIGFDGNIKFVASKVNTDYFWFIGADDAIAKDGLSLVLNAINKQDLLLVDRIECNREMQIIAERKWGDTSLKGFYGNETSNLILDNMFSLGGMFSYISSLIIKKDFWDLLGDLDWFYGDNYYHMYKLSTAFNLFFNFEYLQERPVLCRLDDDFVKKHGVVKRLIFDLVSVKKIIDNQKNIKIKESFKTLMTNSHTKQTIDYLYQIANDTEKKEIDFYKNYYGYFEKK